MTAVPIVEYCPVGSNSGAFGENWNRSTAARSAASRSSRISAGRSAVDGTWFSTAWIWRFVCGASVCASCSAFSWTRSVVSCCCAAARSSSALEICPDLGRTKNMTARATTTAAPTATRMGARRITAAPPVHASSRRPTTGRRRSGTGRSG